MNINLEDHGWSKCPYGTPLWYHPRYRHQAVDVALKIQEDILPAATPHPQEYEPGQVWENSPDGERFIILRGGKTASLARFNHWDHQPEPPTCVRFLGMFKDLYQ